VVSQSIIINQVKMLSEALFPMVVEAIYKSRIAYKEVIVRVIYEDGKNRVQIKQEESSIKWLNLGSLKFNTLTGIPLENEESRNRAKLIIETIYSDIERLFSVRRQPGNMELNLKFRDAGLKSIHITHYKNYGECEFNTVNFHKS
jgi:hypothetical protein